LLVRMGFEVLMDALHFLLVLCPYYAKIPIRER